MANWNWRTLLGLSLGSLLAAGSAASCTLNANEGDPESQAGSGGDGGDPGTAGTSGSGGGAAGSSGAGGSSGVGGGAGQGGGSGASVVDPAPGATETGETKTCSTGGPDSDLSVFVYSDVTDTSIHLTGTVTGAVGNGLYYVSDGTGAIDGPVETASSGGFDLTLPLFCGEQLIKLVWSDASCQLAVVTRVTRIDCTGEDIRLTLSWDDLGSDFELHLIKPGGRINDNATDCTWTSCVGASPDWGVANNASDNPVKDVDDTNAFGPENIYYSSPEPGLYTVMVEHWGSGSPEADGQVVFNVSGHSSTSKIENLASHSVWTAGTIEWPSGQVTLRQDVYDCSGNWAGGCREPLPQ